MTLRDELLDRRSSPPEYALVMPDGWQEYDASDATERMLRAAADRRLREHHRPDLSAQLRAATGRAFAGLRSSAAHRIYLQTTAWADGLILPLSIVASVREAPAGGTLDAAVSDLVRSGATSLHGDRRFVRWQSESSVPVGTATVGQLTTAYLTPYPDRRSHALQFTAVAVHPVDQPAEAWRPLVDRMFDLTDAIVSTFRWRAP